MTARLWDLRGRLTLSVPEAGQLLGIGRDAAYAAVDRGEIDSYRVGRRIVVPTHTLLRRHLGWPDDLIAQALGISPASTAAGSPSQEPTATIHALAAKQEVGGGQHDTPPAA